MISKWQTWLKVICWLAIIFPVALMPLADVSPAAQAAEQAQLQEAAIAGAESDRALGDTGDISITLEAGQYEIKQLDQYSVVEMKGFGFILSPGEPKLPAKTFLIGLPPGAEAISVDMLAQNYEEIPGEYRIMPAPPIASGQENEKVNWEENKEIYSGENAYPSSPYQYLGMGGMRKHNFARVSFCPIAYYPASGKLGLYQNITLRIKYEIVQVVSTELLADTVMDDVASRIIMNYASIKSQYQAAIAPSPVSYNYVIITTDSLQSYVEPLVTWKNAIGYSVNVVTTSWISSSYPGSDLPEKIRDFLVDKYIEWGIEYVLIVGSHSTIPMRYCYPDPSDHNPGSDKTTPTDYYYADLTGNWDSDGDEYFGEYGQDSVDFYPEIYVGRIPVDDSATVNSICQKSVSFEQDSGAWKKKALLLGAISNYATEDYKPWPKTDGAALMEECWDHILSGNGYSPERMYEKEGLEYSTYPSDHALANSNVLDAGYGWPSGYGLVNWDAHGSQTGAHRKIWVEDDGDGFPEASEMVTPPFISSSDASFLDDNKPAIVFSCSCLNGYPENSNNLGKSLLEQGAAAIVASTRVSWYTIGWQDESWGGNSSIDYYFFHYLVNQEQKCGEALYNSKYYYLDHFTSGPFESGEWRHWQNMFDFCLYGEPSLGTASISSPQPDITVSPDSFEETLLPSAIWSDTLTIGNVGDATLTYDINDQDCSWLDEDPKSGTVAVGQPADSITVSIDTAGLTEGNYSAEIVISSNDPDENPTTVPVTLHVHVSGVTMGNVAPPGQMVGIRDTFTVDIYVTPGPDTAIAGVQFDLSFDPSLITADSVEEGNLLSQGGASTYFMAGTIDNVSGTITDVAGAITTPGQTVSSPGTFATISFTAGGTVGTLPLHLYNVIIGDIEGQAVPIEVTDGEVTVAPDWDVGLDGSVNVLDMISVGQYWGETGDPHWIREDVNRDGVISVLDMILVGQYWTG